ncbi:hypothetical protein F7D13_14875 [Methylocystis rosea]|uniref:Uncharacterized protein n=1 Tax=Methylocystis rosea TaxID=173366 RepID=A0ABX6EM63_9HYPH|nr:hypothetical protein [Methylocystis rosea]QGM95208.1 hypothetical protein F7D13_14875 [Methylocystis rosea]
MGKKWSFNYEERAAVARAAHQEIGRTFARLKNRNDEKDPATIAWKAAIARFRDALRLAYPGDFGEDLERLKAGDARGLEGVIRFLEADPMFFGSGYAKADLIRFINRMALTEHQAKRLRAVALAIVERRASQEFRRYCRLAAKVNHPGLQEELRSRAALGEPAVARRARWMLAYVESPPCARRAGR